MAAKFRDNTNMFIPALAVALLMIYIQLKTSKQPDMRSEVSTMREMERFIDCVKGVKRGDDFIFSIRQCMGESNDVRISHVFLVLYCLSWVFVLLPKVEEALTIKDEVQDSHGEEHGENHKGQTHDMIEKDKCEKSDEVHERILCSENKDERAGQEKTIDGGCERVHRLENIQGDCERYEREKRESVEFRNSTVCSKFQSKFDLPTGSMSPGSYLIQTAQSSHALAPSPPCVKFASAPERPSFDITSAHGRQQIRRHFELQLSKAYQMRYCDLQLTDANGKLYKRRFIKGRGWVSVKKIQQELGLYGSEGLVIREN